MNEVTSAVHIVMPEDCNGYEKPRLFGGKLMAWIDVIGAVAARRFAKANVTTTTPSSRKPGSPGAAKPP